jgi:hypothetical protein
MSTRASTIGCFLLLPCFDTSMPALSHRSIEKPRIPPSRIRQQNDVKE